MVTVRAVSAAVVVVVLASGSVAHTRSARVPAVRPARAVVPSVRRDMTRGNRVQSGMVAGDSVAPVRGRALRAGEGSGFLFAFVQPVAPRPEWREIYTQVERCAGLQGNYDAVEWSVIPEPLQGLKGPTYAFTLGNRIVLVQNDTTYLRHEMLHHILEVSGWHPRDLRAGERYSIADLHPKELFGKCTGGR
jgi:hypothetical protein